MFKVNDVVVVNEKNAFSGMVWPKVRVIVSISVNGFAQLQTVEGYEAGACHISEIVRMADEVEKNLAHTL